MARRWPPASCRWRWRSTKRIRAAAVAACTRSIGKSRGAILPAIPAWTCTRPRPICFFSRRGSRARSGLDLFVIERDAPGLTIVDEADLTTDATVARLTLAPLRLANEQLLGYEYEAGAIIAAEQLRIAARSLGIGMRCLAASIEHAKNRVTFGRRLAERQAIQWMLADCRSSLRTHLDHPGSGLARRQRSALLRRGGAGQETRRAHGLPSRRQRDSNSRRLRRLQGIPLRRVLSRGTHDAAALRPRRRDESGGGGEIREEGVSNRHQARIGRSNT